jgi:hypothetical protein
MLPLRCLIRRCGQAIVGRDHGTLRDHRPHRAGGNAKEKG